MFGYPQISIAQQIKELRELEEYLVEKNKKKDDPKKKKQESDVGFAEGMVFAIVCQPIFGMILHYLSIKYGLQ